MTWTRLSDDFYDDDTINSLSHEAFRLHVYALVWCNKQLTDGRITIARARRLLPEVDVDTAIRDLILSGLWSEFEADAFQIDWARQEPSEDVLDRQAANARRNREYRKRKAAHADGDHSLCDPRYCKDTGKRDASRGPSRDNPRPVPSEGQGQGKGTRPTGVAACGHKALQDDTRYCVIGCLLEEVA